VPSEIVPAVFEFLVSGVKGVVKLTAFDWHLVGSVPRRNGIPQTGVSVPDVMPTRRSNIERADFVWGRAHDEAVALADVVDAEVDEATDEAEDEAADEAEDETADEAEDEATDDTEDEMADETAMDEAEDGAEDLTDDTDAIDVFSGGGDLTEGGATLTEGLVGGGLTGVGSVTGGSTGLGGGFTISGGGFTRGREILGSESLARRAFP